MCLILGPSVSCLIEWVIIKGITIWNIVDKLIVLHIRKGNMVGLRIYSTNYFLKRGLLTMSYIKFSFHLGDLLSNDFENLA